MLLHRSSLHCLARRAAQAPGACRMVATGRACAAHRCRRSGADVCRCLLLLLLLLVCSMLAGQCLLCGGYWCRAWVVVCSLLDPARHGSSGAYRVLLLAAGMVVYSSKRLAKNVLLFRGGTAAWLYCCSRWVWLAHWHGVLLPALGSVASPIRR
jgi:hypothetical protein